MRVLMLEVPEELLADRRKKGIDRFDEVWDGVLHLVPPPPGQHQKFSGDLLRALAPAVESASLDLCYGLGVFRPGTGERDYRRCDLVVFREEQVSERGVEGKAELVIEILAPGDESLEKLPFYAECRVSEVMIVDPWTREFDLYVLRGADYFILKDERGAAHSPKLGVTFSRVDGPKLRVSTASGFTDV